MQRLTVLSTRWSELRVVLLLMLLRLLLLRLLLLLFLLLFLLLLLLSLLLLRRLGLRLLLGLLRQGTLSCRPGRELARRCLSSGLGGHSK